MFLKNVKMEFKPIVLISLLIVMTACGGGGGNSDTDTSVTDNNNKKPKVTKATPLKITKDNAPYLAHLGFKLGFLLANLPNDYDKPGDGVLLASQPAPSDLVIRATHDILDGIQNNQSNDIELLGLVVDCIDSGNYTHPNPFKFVGTYTFNSCNENGVTTTGSFVISGVGNKGNFSGKITYKNYTRTSVLGSDKTDGAFNLLYITSDLASRFEMSGLKLTVTEKGLFIWDIIKMDVTNVRDFPLNTSLITVNYKLNIDSPAINANIAALLGSVIVKTTQVFIITLNNRYGRPNSGKGVLEGAGGTKVRLSVDPGGLGRPTDFVTIEIDTTGAGYDSALTRQISWQDLDNI